MTGGSTDEIIAAVEACPTGALRYLRVDGRPEAAAASHDRLPIKDGPLVIRGDLMVVDPKGRELTREGVLRFGAAASENKPFWDNSHRRIALPSDVATPDVARQAATSPADIAPSAISSILPWSAQRSAWTQRQFWAIAICWDGFSTPS